MTKIEKFREKFRKHLRENFLPRNFESDMLYSLFKEDEIPSTLQGLMKEEEEEGYLELVCSSRLKVWSRRVLSFRLGSGMRIAAKFKRKLPRHLLPGNTHHRKSLESSSSSSSYRSNSGSGDHLPFRDWDDSDFLNNIFKLDKILSKLPCTSKKTSTSDSDLDDLGGEDTERTRVADQVRPDSLAAVDHYYKVHFKGESPIIRAATLLDRLNQKDQEFACCYCCLSRRSSPESSSPSMNTSTSDLADFEGGDTAQVAGRECDNNILDQEDLEIGRLSPLLTPPRSFTIADNFKRKRSRQVKKKKMLGYLHRSILFRKMPNKISPLWMNTDSDSSLSSRVTRIRQRFNGKELRCLNKSVKFYAMLGICGQWCSSSGSSSGSDLSDTERVTRERAKWEEKPFDEWMGRGWSRPIYAHVKVLIFVNKSVCKKLAKYLGLIYIEDLLTEAKEDDMFKFNGSRGNLKYCSYIQPYIKKKLLSGSHDICLTHTLYLWETIYADYKGVISESDDKELYSEAKKDTNFYVELGEAPHFFLYLEAVILIISGILRGPFYCIAKYRCEDFGENAYYPLKLSLIAFIPFYILCDLCWKNKSVTK